MLKKPYFPPLLYSEKPSSFLSSVTVSPLLLTQHISLLMLLGSKFAEVFSIPSNSVQNHLGVLQFNPVLTLPTQR